MDKKLGFFLFPRTRSKRGKIQRDRSFLQNEKKNYPDNFHKISNVYLSPFFPTILYPFDTFLERTQMHFAYIETYPKRRIKSSNRPRNPFHREFDHALFNCDRFDSIIRKNTKSLDNFHRMGRKKVGKERRESSRKLFVPRNVRPITRLRANACTHLGPSNGILSPRFAYSRYTFQPRFPERFSWEKTLSLSHAHGRGRGGEREGALLKKSFTSRYLAEVLTACRIECNHG